MAAQQTFLPFLFSECHYPLHVLTLRSIVQQATDSWLSQTSDTVSCEPSISVSQLFYYSFDQSHASIQTFTLLIQTSQRETTIWIIGIPSQIDLDSRSLHYSSARTLPKPSKNTAFNWKSTHQSAASSLSKQNYNFKTVTVLPESHSGCK